LPLPQVQGSFRPIFFSCTIVLLFKSGKKSTRGTGLSSSPIGRCFFSSGIASRLASPKIIYWIFLQQN